MNKFIQSCLEIDANKRISWRELIQHPWLSQELKVYQFS